MSWTHPRKRGMLDRASPYSGKGTNTDYRKSSNQYPIPHVRNATAINGKPTIIASSALWPIHRAQFQRVYYSHVGRVSLFTKKCPTSISNDLLFHLEPTCTVRWVPRITCSYDHRRMKTQRHAVHPTEAQLDTYTCPKSSNDVLYPTLFAGWSACTWIVGLGLS